MKEVARDTWWGRFSLPIGGRGVWHVGPMRLSLSRGRHEWSIEYLEKQEPRNASFVQCPATSFPDGPGLVRHRYAFTEAPESVWIRPVLADRSVVVYPENPFHITAGESITLFCSTPLWVRIEVGDHRLVLLEVPIERPADTWFGHSTREGELCYATETAARLEREDLARHPHRAITELSIRNGVSNTLDLERVNLAVRYLSVYAHPAGGLWTEAVTLDRTSSATIGKLGIGNPPAGSDIEQLTPPRTPPTDDGVLVRAFSALFD
ncbi:MAG: hypothetical protein ACRD21_01060 [Vicinamibacteria bacterium]